MSDKVTAMKTTDSETFLAFLIIKDKEQRDVHFGVENGLYVIGSNKKDINRDNYFTDPCLIIDQDGQIRLQYRNEEGEYASKELDEAKVAKAILDMLKKFKKM